MDCKCSCWAVVKRGVKGACEASPSKSNANTLPRTSLVYDAAAETRYLNASNRELCAPNEAQVSNDVQSKSGRKELPLLLLQFTFQELKSATGNFRSDSILGEGGFGFVFKGWIEENGTAPAKPGTGVTVAVKSLKPDALQGHREWVAEVSFLGQLHHPNLVKLIGYCIEDDQRLLVYEFMTRGSLENHLFRRPLPLPWSTRMKIALGAAKGLAFDVLCNICLIESRSRAITPSGSVMGTKGRLRDVSNGLTTSKELLKILNRIWGLEDQHSSSISLIQALRGELERARLQVDQLIQDQKSDRSEINYWMKKFSEEKCALKIKEQEKIRAAIQSVAEELEMERKFRRRCESNNAKLSRELSETKNLLGKAVKELEGEKRARQILEQVCDELARDIGEDKAEVEELKMESAKVREELEKEREMLQLADVLREERVQMKLSEAKYQFEEKNAAVDKLRNELEYFLGSQGSKEVQNGSRSGRLQGMLEKDDNGFVGSVQEFNESELKEDELDDDEDGSTESDLHSIELNVEDNSKGFRWSFAENKLKTNSLQESENRWNKPTLGKSPKRLDRSLLEDIEWGEETENHKRVGIDRGRFSDSSILVKNETKKDDNKNKILKSFRNQFISSSKKGSSPGYGSPARQSADSCLHQNPIEKVRERLKVVEMAKDMKAKLVDTKK